MSDQPSGPARPARATPLEERLSGYVPLGAPIALVLLALAAWLWLGPGIGILVLAAGALVGAIVALWSSIRALFGETPLTSEDAFAIGAPSNEEEQKRAVLRAIKDLEFEHGVGKISDADYQELMGRYRADAKRLLQLIDDHARPERERAEQVAARHLRAQGLDPGWEQRDPESESADSAGSPPPAADQPEAADEAQDSREPEAADEAQDPREPEAADEAQASREPEAADEAQEAKQAASTEEPEDGEDEEQPPAKEAIA